MVNKNDGVTGRRMGFVASMALAGLLMATVSWVARAQTNPAATAERSSSEQGVTVKVTAKSLGLPGSPWEFAVVLDTHSADLSDDLIQSATLTTDDGRTFKATLNKPSKISAQTWMTQFFGLLCLSRGPFGQFAGR